MFQAGSALTTCVHNCVRWFQSKRHLIASELTSAVANNTETANNNNIASIKHSKHSALKSTKNTVSYGIALNSAASSLSSLSSETLAEGFIAHLSADDLLRAKDRQYLIQQIYGLTSTSRAMFERLYLAPIHRYARLVQQLPASETHHHAYLGGMIDHGLEVMTHALKLRQSYLLPAHAAPEDQALQSEAWSAACAYAGLLHDVGKALTDIQVELANGERWRPLTKPIVQPYRFRFVKGRDAKLHNHVIGLMLQQVLDQEMISWLTQFPDLWKSFLYFMAGQHEKAGLLSEIVNKADRLSVSLNLGGNPDQILNAPIQSLQRQLLRGLIHLVKNSFALNRKGAQAWLTEEALWVVCKVAADKLRVHLLENGYTAIPGNNVRLFDELQSYGIIEPNSVGQAIWTAEVQDGVFTFIKVRPSLIWKEDEPRDYFKGKIVVMDSETSKETSKDREKNDDERQDENIETSKVGELDPQKIAIGVKATDDFQAIRQSIKNKPTAKATPRARLKSISKPTDKPDPKTVIVPLTEEEVAERNRLGNQFLLWLKTAIERGTIDVNSQIAKVHMVEGKAFIVTPNTFMEFSLACKRSSWEEVQRGLESLKIHQKTPVGFNLWRAKVRGFNRGNNHLLGYVLPDPSLIFGKDIPTDNRFLTFDTLQKNGES